MMTTIVQCDVQKKVLAMLICGNFATNSILNAIDERHFSNKNYKEIFLLTKNLKSGNEYSIPKGKEELFFNVIQEIQLDYITDANWQYYTNILISEYKSNLFQQTKKTLTTVNNFEEFSLFYEKQQKLLTKDTIKPVEINDNLLVDIFTDYYKGFEALKTNYTELDDSINGFYPGEFITLAGATSMGKTAVAVNLLLNFAAQEKQCLFISLEMKAIALINRMIANKAKIRGDKIRGRKLTTEEENKYAETFRTVIKPLPFTIIDESRMTIEDIRLQALKLQKEKRLDVLIIDYLGLISSKIKNLYEKTTELSREIKILAKELNVPIICLSQLSRASKERKDKRPLLSDLRDSGSIEQDSDIVLFCHRPEYYDRESKKKGIIEIIIAKHREGEVKIVELAFQKEYQRIINKLEPARTF